MTSSTPDLEPAALDKAIIAGRTEADEYGVPTPNDAIFEAAIRAYLAARLSVPEAGKTVVELIPDGESVTLDERPEGLFLFGETLCVMTEYSTYSNGVRQRDACIVSSGEYFWGGVNLPADRAKLIVQPLISVFTSEARCDCGETTQAECDNCMEPKPEPEFMGSTPGPATHVLITIDQLCRTPLIEALTPTDSEWEGCSSIQDRYDLMKRRILSALASVPTPSGAAEPVAWRWRPKGATLWIYNPQREWSWRRVAERLERERQTAEATVSDLRLKLEEARKALEPFAAACPKLFNDWCPDETPAWWIDGDQPGDENRSPVSVGDFRAAARALTERKEAKHD